MCRSHRQLAGLILILLNLMILGGCRETAESVTESNTETTAETKAETKTETAAESANLRYPVPDGERRGFNRVHERDG